MNAFDTNSKFRYDLLLSFTIFTSTVKATKLISFHKAFMQIAATIRYGFALTL